MAESSFSWSLDKLNFRSFLNRLIWKNSPNSFLNLIFFNLEDLQSFGEELMACSSRLTSEMLQRSLVGRFFMISSQTTSGRRNLQDSMARLYSIK